MQNFLLLTEIGKQDKPVLLKRGFSNTMEETLMAAEYIAKSGNMELILCERGIRTFESYTRNTLDISAIPILKSLSHLPVIVDPSHAAEFHQIEGLYVDTEVSLADLKREIEVLIQQLFGPQMKIRFRPDFFPFVEPGVDVSMTCFRCEGNGCSICKQSGWIEIMGARMVHPNVFRSVGYDPDVYTGFAFGIGVDRVAMILHDIGDIRLFLANDMRFLSQF